MVWTFCDIQGWKADFCQLFGLQVEATFMSGMTAEFFLIKQVTMFQ